MSISWTVINKAEQNCLTVAICFEAKDNEERNF